MRYGSAQADERTDYWIMTSYKTGPMSRTESDTIPMAMNGMNGVARWIAIQGNHVRRRKSNKGTLRVNRGRKQDDI